MTKAEKILICIAIIAAILKLAEIPMASVILILSVGILSFAYLLLSFFILRDGQTKQQVIGLSIAWGILLGYFPVAILFRLMWWPGATNMLFCMLITALILLLVIYFLRRSSSENLRSYYNKLFNRTLIAAILCGIFYLIPTETIIKVQHRNDPELAKLEIRSYENPRNEEYSRARYDYIHTRDSIRYSRGR